MGVGRVILCALALILANTDFADSQRRPENRNQTQSTQQPAATEQRGTDKSPVVIKVLPPEDAEAKTKQEAADSAAKDQFDTNTLRLGIATVVVAFLQFVAIGVQAVFLWFAFKAAKYAVNAAETQAKIADRALIASERAWVSVDIQITSDLTFDSQGSAQIGFSF